MSTLAKNRQPRTGNGQFGSTRRSPAGRHGMPVSPPTVAAFDPDEMASKFEGNTGPDFAMDEWDRAEISHDYSAFAGVNLEDYAGIDEADRPGECDSAGYHWGEFADAVAENWRIRAVRPQSSPSRVA